MKKPNHPWCDRKLLIGPYLTLCLTEKQFTAVSKHLKLKEPLPWDEVKAGTCWNLECSGGKYANVVALKGWEKKPLNEVRGLLVHEATHVWQNTKEWMGEKNPGREQEAYAMQNIAQELFDMFDKLSKRKR